MRILAYDDNPDFGGHQIMTCRGLESLATDPSIELIFAINPANRKLVDSAGSIPRCTILDETDISIEIKANQPELMLCIQGDISQSNRGIELASKYGIRCTSYLALPHPLAEMGAKLGHIRDRIQRHRINQPDRYITLSDSMKQLLQDRGCTQPIAVVPNGIPLPDSSQRKAPEICTTIGLLGRIEFKQKRQDFLVEAFQQDSAFANCRLIIAGGGPDRKQLEKIVSGHADITLEPWQDDPESFYEQIDLLIIPSRYEGVPLVMLEALARGIPVIGTNRDGMKDVLPREWTFEAGNAGSLADTFSHVRTTWQNEIERLRKHISDTYSIERFQENFRHAVLDG